MRFWPKSKRRLTGISLNGPIGGGLTWENESDEREARARAERADAFAELWGIAQDAHIGLRDDFDRVDELSDVRRQLNTLLIKKAPALDPADVELAQDFVSAIGEFIRRLRPAPGQEAARVREEIATTVASPEFPEELDEQEICYQRVIELNESLKRRYRAVVFGEGE